MACLVAIVDYTYHISYAVAIVDLTHVGTGIASFKDLVTVAQENSTNQTATASLGLGNSFQKGWKN